MPDVPSLCPANYARMYNYTLLPPAGHDSAARTGLVCSSGHTRTLSTLYGFLKRQARGNHDRYLPSKQDADL
jgi:hypothetical protein